MRTYPNQIKKMSNATHMGVFATREEHEHLPPLSMILIPFFTLNM
jgi:hypothetical protein